MIKYLSRSICPHLTCSCTNNCLHLCHPLLKQLAIRQTLARLLLSPISLLYGMAIGIRNFFYDVEVVRSSSFSLPVISVGNLSVGGAGKTPHVEYLIRLLRPYLNVATLSRGYKRKTKGFRFIQTNDTALLAGDEPLQYRRKYRDIVVSVGENRSIAIPQILQRYPDTQVILLDDAYQHRAVTPSLNILLTSYEAPFYEDYLLPSGRLREYRDGYQRADIILVTKCPDQLSAKEQSDIIEAVQPLNHQKVFFTRYIYGHPYSFHDPRRRLQLDEQLDVILVSAIANTGYLVNYLSQYVEDVQTLDYEDHRVFTNQDIAYIDTVYKQRDSKRKVILTTEKDAMRLDLHRKEITALQWQIFVLPVQVDFLQAGAVFNQLVKEHLLEFQS